MSKAEATTFYDQHPFDWAVTGPDTDIRAFVSPLLAELIESLDVRSLVLDVGCGPGRVLGFLARRGFRCIGIDRSRVSIGRATARYGRPGIVGDNLKLPIADSVADVVISDGVIHHTDSPHAAFLENLRVLRPGGRFYLAVYKPSGRYPFLYRVPGMWIRTGLQGKWTRPLVILLAQVPYFLVHFARTRGNRTWMQTQNLFYDYFVSPRVAFLSRGLIESWCAGQDAQVLRYDENRGGNVHCFVLLNEPVGKKRDSIAATPLSPSKTQ
ncbi:MAG TPA: class I SAM-dependent methyltransferase [Chthoniobacterales bacterium]|jgi:SAM-dependent methyltransferase|nr:class I SAM-dependent methyltransferase [Chthoniobacterales bacterium]